MFEIKQFDIDFIKQFEGFSARKYICPAGIPTIGFGHVITDNEKYNILTESEAEELLKEDLEFTKSSILRNIYIDIHEHQFTALLSFTFNLGGAALQRSTLRQKINSRLHEQVPKEFMKWVWGGGRILPGLIKRRMAESCLYEKNI